MFVAALVVPGVFQDEGVLFGAAFLVVCAMHAALYALAGRGNPELLGAVLWPRRGPAGRDPDPGRGLHGQRAHVALDAAPVRAYSAPRWSGSTGWQVHPSHLAERYGLVLIIALGEAFISIGIGATGIGIGLGEVVAAILGLLVATSFWLAYFDFFAIRGERILVDAQGPERRLRPRRVHLPPLSDDRRDRLAFAG